MAMAHTDKNNKTNTFRLQMTALCKEVDAVDVGNHQNKTHSRKKSELTKNKRRAYYADQHGNSLITLLQNASVEVNSIHKKLFNLG
jgi:hypothetical protein